MEPRSRFLRVEVQVEVRLRLLLISVMRTFITVSRLWCKANGTIVHWVRILEDL